MQLNKSFLAIDYGQTELWTFVILELLLRLKIMLAWFTYYIDTFDKGGGKKALKMYNICSM